MLVRELLREMRAHGWTCARIRGSHGQWVSPDGSARITVVMNHRSARAGAALRQWRLWQARKKAA